MSEVNENENEPNPSPPPPEARDDLVAAPENRSERWMKYGLNVLLTSLLVVILAVLVVLYLAWTLTVYFIEPGLR